jgi:hypothetical protein
MNVYECALVIADGIAETQAVGAAIELQVERIIGTQAATSGGVSDGDKGDISVSASGTVWTVDARAITASKLFEVGANKLLGRHTGTSGDAQEISVDGGLEFHGGQLRRAALTGAVSAAAGSGTTTLARNGAVAGNYYKWDGASWVPAEISYLEDIGDIPSTFPPSAHTHPATGISDSSSAGRAIITAADAAAQRAALGLGTAATSATVDFAAASHTHTLSNLTQSGATTNQIIQWNGTAWVPVTFTAGIGGTTGATDNALLRADGTGGATVQTSTVTIDDSGNVSHANWTVGSGTYSTRTYAKVGAVASNLALILCPTGTGFISSQIPDGTTAGGNLRGNNAVDFTYSRALATDVASGAGAVAFHQSRVSGTNAFGVGNGLASGQNSFAGGQNYATASGVNSWIYAFGGTASGQYAFAFGLFPTASGSYTSAIGERPSATLYGQFAEASGMFGATGDAQRSRLTARRATTDDTPSNLFLDGSSARIVVPANSSGVAMVTVIARTNTAGDQHMTWRRRVNWERGVAVGTVTVDVETVGTDRGYTGGAWGSGPAWSIAITADTTNGAINISATGAAATNIRWVASIEWVETTFA